MPALLIYLFKVNVALLLFCAGYYFIFRRLTFYTLNRAYLVTVLLFSSVYPLLDFSNILPQHNVVKPLQVTDVQLIYRISNYSKSVTSPSLETYWQYLLIIFWTGLTMMTIRLVLQFASLFNIHRRSIPQKIHKYQVRVIKDEASAFSFWQSVYINPDKYSENEIKSVVAHEEVHVKQWHTLDILLAEISLVFYWFNPGIWLIKKAISENLEFITDREILRQGVDAKNYQYSLLYASFNTSPNAVVNHFNISTIKKRIMMMNSKKSSIFSLTRYGLMLPAVVALLLVFGTSKAALIKESFTRANEITGKAFNAAHDIVFDSHKAIEANAIVKLNNERPISAKLRAFVGVTPNVQTQMIATDTPKTKAVPPKAIIAGPGADSIYYVLNGKPINYEQVQNIDPNSIESVSILKDAAATSLFGNAASKGAVLIVTKGEQNSAANQRMLQRISAANTMTKTSVSKGNTSVNLTGSASLLTKADSSRAANSEPSPRPVVAIGSKTQNRTITVRGYASPQKKITVGPNGSLREIVVQGFGTERINGNTPGTKFLVDGKEVTKEEFEALDPNKIESINVIKDAAKHNDTVKVTTKSTSKPASKN